MAEWFRREGSTVHSAEHGAEALRLLQTNRVDVVVSDIHMPVMDGVTMLQKIKSINTYLPSVIFITHFYDIEPREAYELGAEAMMSKPVERKQLLSAVARILTPREDLWRLPPADKADAVLLADFESLAAALPAASSLLDIAAFVFTPLTRSSKAPWISASIFEPIGAT